jgi:hypothetical protein
MLDPYLFDNQPTKAMGNKYQWFCAIATLSKQSAGGAKSITLTNGMISA